MFGFGGDFWTQGSRICPQDVPAGLGTFFAQKWGPEKDGFPQEILPQGVIWGSVQGEWMVWYPGGLWAGPFPPKPYQKKKISAIWAPPGPRAHGAHGGPIQLPINPPWWACMLILGAPHYRSKPRPNRVRSLIWDRKPKCGSKVPRVVPKAKNVKVAR